MLLPSAAMVWIITENPAMAMVEPMLVHLLEFQIYGVWEAVCSLLGILGNVLLLYTFYFYPRVLLLDHVSVTIMRNLAVVDLISALFIPSTLAISYLGGLGTFWPMSDAWCTIYAYLKHGPTVANILFVMSFSLYRVYRCVFPLRSRNVDEKRVALIMTCSIWTITVLTPAYMLFFTLTKHLAIQYQNGYDNYGSCDFIDIIHPLGLAPRPKALLAVLLVFVPGVITMLSNTVLLVYVLGMNIKLSLRIKTTIFVTSIFILTYFPYATVILVTSMTPSAPSRIVRHVCARCVSLGCWSNLPVYLVVDPKLRAFIWDMLVSASKGEKIPQPVAAKARFKAVGVAAVLTAKLAATPRSRRKLDMIPISPIRRTIESDANSPKTFVA